MTLQEFDNQKWYKGIKIKYEGGEYFVWRIDFGLNRVQISYKSRLESSLIWLLYTEFTIVQEEPTALDLIAAEREKQISKGYTVEHDAEYTERTGINYADIAARLAGFRPICPPEWDQSYWDKLLALPEIDKARICATWMARELERLLFIQNKEKCK